MCAGYRSLPDEEGLRRRRCSTRAGQAGSLDNEEAKCVQDIEHCLARKEYAGAAAAQAELTQRLSASGHDKQDEKQRIGENNERERKAKEEEGARNIDELLAQKDYGGAAALQARMGTLGSAADQAQEEHEATGGAGAVDRR